jgi:hypothetical protein
LGSLITQDLLKDNNEDRRTNQANAQVCEITNALRSKKDVTTEFKKLLRIQLPLDPALWGAKKSWTLTVHNERRSETFHHKSAP